MATNTREFLRSFTTFKAKARRGEVVRLHDKQGDYLFTAATARRLLLGAAAGRIVCHADLTKPTLSAAAWKPSL
jgi:hypothetical protein